MTDTPPEVDRLYREMLMSRSAAKRFRMGLDLFALAGQMMLAGLRAEGGERDLRARAFLRLYGDEFSAAEQQEIVKRIRRFELEERGDYR